MRRGAVGRTVLGTLLALAVAAPASQARRRVAGRVFDETTGRALGGVQVSNGQVVVRTDSAGMYRIEVDPERHRFITVCVPAGYRPAKSYFHRVEDIKGRADFPLRPWPPAAGKVVRIAAVADGQVTRGDSTGRGLDETIEEFNAMAPALAFATHLGDVIDGSPSSYANFLALSGKHKMPFYPIMGNHDTQYEDYVGPAMYSFNAGPYHFVTFFGVDERVRAWLVKDITANADRRLVVLYHYPAGYNPRSSYSPIRRAGLVNFKPVAWLCGHDHINYTYPFLTTLDIRTGSFNQWRKRDATPKGYRIVTLDESGVRDCAFYPTGIGPLAHLAWPRDGAVVAPSRLTVRAGGLKSGAFALAARCRLVPVGGEPGPWTKMSPQGAFRWRAGLEVSRPGSYHVELAMDFGLPVEGSPRQTVTARADFTVAAEAGPEATSTGVPRPPLRLAWSAPLGGMDYGSRPTPTGKMLLVGTSRDDLNDFGGITALDIRTGRRLWRREVGDVKFDIVSDGRRAYFISSRNRLYALDLATGRPCWQALGFKGQRNTPLLRLIGGALWAGTRQPVRIDPATGQVDKDAEPPGPTPAEAKVHKAVRATRVRPSRVRGIGYVAGEDDVVVGTIARGSGWDMVGVDVAAGKALWRRRFGRVRPTVPARAGQVVFVGTDRGEVLALDVRSGRTLWKTQLGLPVYAPPAVAGNAVFFVDMAGTVYAFVGS